MIVLKLDMDKALPGTGFYAPTIKKRSVASDVSDSINHRRVAERVSDSMQRRGKAKFKPSSMSLEAFIKRKDEAQQQAARKRELVKQDRHIKQEAGKKKAFELLDNMTDGDWGRGKVVRQGDAMFGTKVRAMVRKMALSQDMLNNTAMKCPSADGKLHLNSYQRMVKAMMHPSSPVHRMLVLHHLGTGKTLSMIMILEQYYHTSVPALLFFPTSAQMNNFYKELMKHHSKFRDFAMRHFKKQGSPEKLNEPQEWRDLFEKKGRVQGGKIINRYDGEPECPLRAFTFAEGGGANFLTLIDPILKFSMLDRKEHNIFDKCIIMADEAHLICHGDKKDPTTTRRLEKRITSCQNSKVVLATATPIVSKASDIDDVMKMVYGRTKPAEPYTGYISNFMNRPLSVFPEAPPKPTLVLVPLAGKNLAMYMQARKQKKSTLQLYENMSGWYRNEADVKRVMKSSTSLDALSTKFAKIVQDTRNSGKKTAIIIHRDNGARLLHAMFKKVGVDAKLLINGPDSTVKERAINANMSKGLIDKFNGVSAAAASTSVLIMDSRDFSEGISLKKVRRLVLADITPGVSTDKSNALNWAKVKQRMARAVRLCSHDQLSEGKRNVGIYIYVSTLGHGQDKTLDEKKYDVVMKSYAEIEKKMCELETASIEGPAYYGQSDCFRGVQTHNKQAIQMQVDPTPMEIDWSIYPTNRPKSARPNGAMVMSSAVHSHLRR